MTVNDAKKQIKLTVRSQVKIIKTQHKKEEECSIQRCRASPKPIRIPPARREDNENSSLISKLLVVASLVVERVAKNIPTNH